MGETSPTPTRRTLMGAFVATSAALVPASPTRETLQREFDAWDDRPIILKRTRQGQRDSRFRYEHSEHFFLSIENGFIVDRFDFLYQTGIVMQLGLSAHLFDVGFTDDWCRDYIGLRIAKSLGYANATGFDYRDPDTNLLAAVLTPYGKWRAPAPWDDHDDGPFTTDEMRKITRALLDHVQRVTGHPRPYQGRARHA